MGRGGRAVIDFGGFRLRRERIEWVLARESGTIVLFTGRQHYVVSFSPRPREPGSAPGAEVEIAVTLAMPAPSRGILDILERWRDGEREGRIPLFQTTAEAGRAAQLWAGLAGEGWTMPAWLRAARRARTARLSWRAAAVALAAALPAAGLLLAGSRGPDSVVASVAVPEDAPPARAVEEARTERAAGGAGGAEATSPAAEGERRLAGGGGDPAETLLALRELREELRRGRPVPPGLFARLPEDVRTLLEATGLAPEPGREASARALPALPMPGGGDLRSPDDLAAFGLRLEP